MSSIVNCLMKACRLEGVNFRAVDKNNSVLVMNLFGGNRVVFNTTIGLLTDAESVLFKDKYYSYELFGQDHLFPRTAAFIDPNADQRYIPFVSGQSVTEIADEIMRGFGLPVIVKRNSGTRGQNVFVCYSKQDVIGGLNRIYSKQQIEYDHVALAQCYIKPKAEYRVVVLDNQVEFSYVKPHHRPDFGGVIEPVLITNVDLKHKFNKLVDQVSGYYSLVYAGLDVIEDETGKLSLIEINGSPSFAKFIQTNGDELVVGLFRKVISKLNMQPGRCPSTWR